MTTIYNVHDPCSMEDDLYYHRESPQKAPLVFKRDVGDTISIRRAFQPSLKNTSFILGNNTKKP